MTLFLIWLSEYCVWIEGHLRYLRVWGVDLLEPHRAKQVASCWCYRASSPEKFCESLLLICLGIWNGGEFWWIFCGLYFLGTKKARRIFKYSAELGVHSLSLERETSTGVLANFSRELANFSREFANFKRESALFCAKFGTKIQNLRGTFLQLVPALEMRSALTATGGRLDEVHSSHRHFWTWRPNSRSPPCRSMPFRDSIAERLSHPCRLP